jgi:hypothetical protein
MKKARHQMCRSRDDVSNGPIRHPLVFGSGFWPGRDNVRRFPHSEATLKRMWPFAFDQPLAMTVGDDPEKSHPPLETSLDRVRDSRYVPASFVPEIAWPSR